MRLTLGRGFLLVSLFVVSAGWAQAQYDVGIAVPNWTVPPYRGFSASGGLSTMADITAGVAFVGMQPCRLVDTRPSQGFAGQWGPPIMAANAIRTFDLDSAPHCTGIPAGVEAYSLNFAVTETAGQPGDIRAWPTGTPPVSITSVLNWNFVGAAAIANSIIIPAGTNGQIDVQVAGFNTHLVIDINGYFTDQYNPGVTLHAVSSTETTPAITGENTSTFGNAWGVLGRITSATTGPGSAGVRGVNNGTGSAGVGVWGSHAGNGWAVYGNTVGGLGVFGEATTTSGSGIGVLGVHDGVAFGVYGESAAGTGVYGEVLHTTGTALSGVEGITYSEGQNSAGVRGNNVDVVPGNFLAAGVRGQNAGSGFGVLGLTTTGYSGASGYLLTAMGAIDTGADLGFTDTVGLNIIGDSQATGMKNFVEPHPTDASKVIRYASLEGNEVGTYFRGRGKFQNGIAVIEVPEDFRIVTDPDGLSIQVTPIGDMATVAVQSIGLARIVVRGSRNVEFFYTVNGIRLAYRDAGPIAANEKVFVPRSPDERIPESYPAVLRERLISNGTYKPDGTVNMETARRLGWDRDWEKRDRPAPQPTE
jgi:hypothetical protein